MTKCRDVLPRTSINSVPSALGARNAHNKCTCRSEIRNNDKECDKTCHKCHKKGHIKKDCLKYKNVSSTRFDHCYVLTHNARSVHANFVGTPIVGNKKEVIWLPMTLVTDIQGPK
jgi:hypothetical protein